jgi:hypothetical protein
MIVVGVLVFAFSMVEALPEEIRAGFAALGCACFAVGVIALII